MQHPFEGVLQPGDTAAEAKATRRSVLGTTFGAIAGLFGFAGAVSAQAIVGPPTTLALGEEGGRMPLPPAVPLVPPTPRVPRVPTTLALGEEGGRY
jgi:hypothetical protein